MSDETGSFEGPVPVRDLWNDATDGLADKTGDGIPRSKSVPADGLMAENVWFGSATLGVCSGLGML
jgi:hypothetical protein